MRLNAGLQCVAKFPRESDPIAFDHEIQIEILNAQQQISHTAANDEQRQLTAVGQFPSLFE